MVIAASRQTKTLTVKFPHKREGAEEVLLEDELFN
jgi:hypothetical protein